MSGSVTHTSVSPSMVYTQSAMDQPSNIRDDVNQGAKDIHHTTKKAVDDQGFKMLSIISWGKRIVSKCGFLGYPLVLLVSPFLVPVSFVYDGVRGITLLYRKIAKIETAVEKLLPRTDQHVKDVEQLLNEKVASDSEFQAQAEQLRAEKEQSGQQMAQLQQKWINYHQYHQNDLQQVNAYLRTRAGTAEQTVSELTQKLNQVFTDWNKTDQEYQTEKNRLSAELKQLMAELVKKDNQAKESKRRLVEANDALRQEKSQNSATRQQLTGDIDKLKKMLTNRENDVIRLQEQQQQLRNELNDSRTRWEAKAQQDMNTINDCRTQLADLKNSNVVEKSQLMMGLDITQFDDVQGQEIDLTMTEICGWLKDQLAKGRQELDYHKKTFETERTQLYLHVNNLNEQCQGLKQELQSAQYKYQADMEMFQVENNSLKSVILDRECKISELKKHWQSIKESYSAEHDKLQEQAKRDKINLVSLRLEITRNQQNYKEKTDELNKMLVEANNNIEDLRHKCNKIEREKQEIESQCADFKKQVGNDLDLNKVNARLTDSLKEKDEKIQELSCGRKETVRKLQETETQYLNTKEQLEGRICTLEISLKDRENNAFKLNDEWQRKYNEVQEEKKAREQELTETRSELKTTRLNLEKVKEDNENITHKKGSQIKNLSLGMEGVEQKLKHLQESAKVECEQFQENVDTVEARLENLKSQSTENEYRYQTDLDALKVKVNDLNNALDKKDNRFQELELKNKELYGNAARLKEEITDLNNKLMLKGKEIEKLYLQIEAGPQKYQEVEYRNQEAKQELNAKIGELKNALKCSDDKIVSLEKEQKKQLEKLSVEYVQLQGNVKNKQAAIDLLEEEMKKLKIDLELSQSQIKALDSKITQDKQNNQAEIHKLKNELAKKENVLKTLQQERNDLKKEKQKDEDDLKEKEGKNQDLSLKMAELRSKVADGEDAQKNLRTQLDNSKRGSRVEVEQLKVTISAKENLIKTQQGDINRDEVDGLRSEKDALEMNLAVIEGNNEVNKSQHCSENISVYTQTNKLQSDVLQVPLCPEAGDEDQEGLKELASRISELENEVKAKEAQLSELQKTREQQLEELVPILKSKVDEVGLQEGQTMITKLTDLSNRLDKANQQIETLREKLAKKENIVKLKIYQEANAHLHSEIGSLKRQVNDLTLTNKSLHKSVDQYNQSSALFRNGMHF